jgi:membrane-associated protein
MSELIHQFLHLDQTLDGLLGQYGRWVYVLLFAIIFAETGLVVMPFLPGDSLLFAAGIFTAGENARLNLLLLLGLLIVAGILGDAVNYAVGKWIGPRVFKREGSVAWVDKLLNRKHLDRAHAFYEKYGGKAVVLGRFVPIIRTFVPFVAGAGSMNYGKFVWYNISGAILWVGVCVLAGHFFGNIPAVRDNFGLIAIGIVVVSLLPIVIEIIIAKRNPALLKNAEDPT